MGFAVTTASNGYAGLRLAADLRPNLVVLGSGLPELTGPQVVTELRKRQDCSRIGVMLASNLKEVMAQCTPDISAAAPADQHSAACPSPIDRRPDLLLSSNRRALA